MGLFEELKPAFEPKSIAILGASSEKGKVGYRSVKLLLDFGYKGQIYPVNPKPEPICGLQTFPSLKDIPGEVERALIVVPAKVVPQVIGDCVEKGVKIAQIYTAGFGEAGDSGKDLERIILEKARSGNLRVIGPNCLGTYCPKSRIAFDMKGDMKEGDVAFISQSGGLTGSTIKAGSVRGISFSKAISIGNCCDLDPSDFLEYLRDDPDTKIITMYLEGTKDGRRFFNLLKDVTKNKPVIILKGGRSNTGKRAAEAHTAALAGDFLIWEAIFKQTGVIGVDSLEEMIDMVVALKTIPSLRGRKLAVIGNGGGRAVIASDLCEKMNLFIPLLSEGTLSELRRLDLPAGTTLRNPVDTPMGALRREQGAILSKILAAIGKEPEIDFLLVHIELETVVQSDLRESNKNHLKNIINSIEANSSSQTPMIVVFQSSNDPETAYIKKDIQDEFVLRGIPLFWTLNSAILAASRRITYQEYLQRFYGLNI